MLLVLRTHLGKVTALCFSSLHLAWINVDDRPLSLKSGAGPWRGQVMLLIICIGQPWLSNNDNLAEEARAQSTGCGMG